MAKRKQEQSVDFKGLEADIQEPAVKKSKLDPQICEDCFYASGADSVCEGCGFPHDEDELDANGMCEVCGGGGSDSDE
jgi:hypothetical protein